LPLLPAKHVDTGMGFERVTAVLQGKDSNYDTDVFTPLFQAIREATSCEAKYTGKLDDRKDIAYRVIADHIRALTFALTDGAVPSNEGRGYVLRSILRRAERYGWQYLKSSRPFLYKLVETVVKQFGDQFPELRRNPQKVRDMIQSEEESFQKTMRSGITLFEHAIWDAIGEILRRPGERVRREMADFPDEPSHFVFESNSGERRQVELFPYEIEKLLYKFNIDPKAITISADTAFMLHDTCGVYIDIVEQMASERGINVDRGGFNTLMEAARERSRAAQKKRTVTAVQGDLPKTDDSLKY